MKRYFHELCSHNTNAAFEIVPELIRKVRPKSVIDVGCGIGTWLAIFEKEGIQDYLGIDGEYVEVKSLLFDPKKFVPIDLNAPFQFNRKFDLVVCLEVAEHLEASSAKHFIRSLAALGNVIVFSAAIPGQGGQNHINEQFPDYWIELFAEMDFVVSDDIRMSFWNNKNVEWWYRQNLVVFTKGNSSSKRLSFPTLVHPELYQKKLHENAALIKQNEDYLLGRVSVVQAGKILLKAIFNTIWKKN